MCAESNANEQKFIVIDLYPGALLKFDVFSSSRRATDFFNKELDIISLVQWSLDITRGQALMRFFLLFHICYWGEENCLLYWGLRQIVVHFIKVPLYYFSLGKKVGDAFHYLSVLIEELCLSALDLAHV